MHAKQSIVWALAALLATVNALPNSLEYNDKGAIDPTNNAHLDTQEPVNTDLVARDPFAEMDEYFAGEKHFKGEPPCLQIWPQNPGREPSDQEIANARKEAQWKKYPVGSKPPICDLQYVTCLRLGKGVPAGGRGFWQIATWDGGDGTKLTAVKYWQSSITWVMPGGSAKCYLAHGCQWCCANGILNIKYEEENYFLSGVSQRPEDKKYLQAWDSPAWNGACHCGYHLSSDLTIVATQKK
ncbi:hypothetical protein CB0940_02354 [Cercospora beticola]|uniref:Secreted protein n=1 Tax=Cercospora beticola TaxID=122368 RepID=A0A2G5I3J1_CERBT|nr:hypothetical protein CB0940_02354 [Cercospora beticola]PIA99386.1 hypothetical protein CB0940_02354 [Cercospora beticola]WPA99484.1 hypothetical protein RHO25_004102 [Cercospora beticola]